MNRSRYPRGLILAGIAIIAVLCVVFKPDPDIPFDSAAWKNAQLTSMKERNNSLRSHMLSDLYARHKLIGLTRARVEDLLGKPDQIQCSDYDSNYYIGPQRGPISLHGECLGVRFENDRVVKANTWME